jgi:polyisoprenoid-binding protein YceI
MHTARALALAAPLLAAPALADDSYSIDTRHTYPYFHITHMGFSQQMGRFNKVTGKVTLDSATGKGSVQVSIDAASIDMGLEDWDKHMRGPDFFNVEKYPSMTFSADQFTFEAGKPVSVDGTFTLLGVSRPVKIAINGFNCGIHLMLRKTVCGANLSTSLRRSEFGMLKYLPMIGDDVLIQIPIEAIKD